MNIQGVALSSHAEQGDPELLQLIGIKMQLPQNARNWQMTNCKSALSSILKQSARIVVDIFKLITLIKVNRF